MKPLSLGLPLTRDNRLWERSRRHIATSTQTRILWALDALEPGYIDPALGHKGP